MKRSLKLAAEAFKPANLARVLNAARHPPSQAEIDAALEHASPEQRAAYAAQVARSEAGAQMVYDDAKAQEEQRRALYGPAGLAVFGLEVQTPEMLSGQSAGASFKFARVELNRQAKQTVRDVPDRIFGVYRVPDRISQAVTPHSETGRPVEWDFVYRDRPEYARGRERWAAYQEQQLQARLERATGIRRRLESGELPGVLGKVARATELVERLHWDHWFEGLEEEPIPYRYCWPPT